MNDASWTGLERVIVPTALGDVVVRRSAVMSSGTATILLHGAAGSWTTWVPLLAAAKASGHPLRDLVIPDLPGWGESTLADTDQASVESLTSVVASVVEASGYDRWHVIGHSMGGFIALDLAAARPDATVDVRLISATTLGGQGSTISAVRRFASYPKLVALLAIMRMLGPLGRAGTGLVRWLARLGMLRALTAPLFAPRARVEPSVIAALANEVRPRAFVNAMRCSRRYDAQARWGWIGCEVQAVHGDHDVFVGRDDDVQLARIIPRFSVQVIADTGHFGHVERPAEVLNALGFPWGTGAVEAAGPAVREAHAGYPVSSGAAAP